MISACREGSEHSVQSSHFADNKTGSEDPGVSALIHVSATGEALDTKLFGDPSLSFWGSNRLELRVSLSPIPSHPNNDNQTLQAKWGAFFIWLPQGSRRTQRGPLVAGKAQSILKASLCVVSKYNRQSDTLNNSWLIWLPWDKLFFLLRLCYTRNRALRGEIPLQSQSEITLCVVFRLFSFGKRKKRWEANF